METVFIYILIDPTTNQIRYVGKTTDIKRRIRRHINERFIHNSYKDRWIRKLIDNDYLPEIEVVDIIPKKNWVYWDNSIYLILNF